MIRKNKKATNDTKDTEADNNDEPIIVNVTESDKGSYVIPPQLPPLPKIKSCKKSVWKTKY